MWAEIPGERLVDSLGEVATGVDERHPHELSVELPLPSEMGNRLCYELLLGCGECRLLLLPF